MVSSTNPAYNLTVHNTASNSYSLDAMTIVVVIFLPLVLAYQSWTYYVFRRRVSRDEFVTGRPPAEPLDAIPEQGARVIPARYIGDEYFRFHEAGRAFIGNSRAHRLGDPVTVELVEAAPVAGALRFRLVRHASAAAPRPGKGRPSRRACGAGALP